jgi:tRNA-intron endonuclease
MSEEIQGRLSDGRIRLGPEALSDLYEQGYFGRPRGKGLELSLVEAAYLLDRSRIRITREGKELDFRAFFQEASSLEKGFEFRYVVYKDLRERGYYVQPGRPDFRVYPRGGHPGKSAAEFYVLVISERMPLPLKEIIEPVRVAGQMRKKLMLAIVDEESDITFYEAREKAMSGLMAKEEEGGMATLLEDRVVLWDAEASQRLHEHGFYGKPVGERLQLSLVESAYLLEKGLIQLNDRSGAAVDLESLMVRARQIESDFDQKFSVYKDLRDKKLVVKTGFKFGTHFRVYKQVEGTRKAPHSEYLVHTIPLDHIFFPPVLSRAVRLAHSVRKQMVFAYPDIDVRYLEVRRLKP